MGRPSSITPELAAKIAAADAPGISVDALHKRLGGAVSKSTLYRHVKRNGRGGTPTTALASALRARAKTTPAAAPTTDEDPEGLPYLERVRRELIPLADQIRPRVAYDRSAALSHKTVMADIGEISKVVAELRPRAEIEAERLEALGDERRDTLVTAARAASDGDAIVQLQEQLADKDRALEVLRRVLASDDDDDDDDDEETD